jgi:hypothetical protein
MIQSAHHHAFFISALRMITKIGASCHNRISLLMYGTLKPVLFGVLEKSEYGEAVEGHKMSE